MSVQTVPIYLQEDDPGDAAGPGALWSDGTAVKMRDATNEDWIILGESTDAADIQDEIGSPDDPESFGGGVEEEFVSGASPFTWSVAVDSEDVAVSRKSHLKVKRTATNTETLGTMAWAPGAAVAFDVRAKISFGSETAAGTNQDAGIHIGNSDNSSRLLLQLISDSGTRSLSVAAFTYATGSYTQRGSTWSIGQNEIYMRITRDGSNNVSFWFSKDGYAWTLIATQAFTFTPANLGFRMFTNGASTTNLFVDWLRTDV